MDARDLMKSDATWISADASIAEAARALADGTRCLLVGTPDRPPAGIVTAVDVLRAALARALKPRRVAHPEAADRPLRATDLPGGTLFAELARAARRVPVSAVMSSPVCCIDARASAAEVLDLLIGRKIESAPVLSEGRVAGVLHRRALLGALERLMGEGPGGEARRDEGDATVPMCAK